MFGGIGSKRGIVAKKGGSADVTPDAVNWSSTFRDSFINVNQITFQRITGISSSIVVKVEYDDSTAAKLVYKISDDEPELSFFTGNLVSEHGFTQINNNGTFSVSNNKYVAFGVIGAAYYVYKIVTIKNNSDGAAILDEVDLLLCEGCY